MGDNGKGGVKNGWHHLWTAPDVQNKQKNKAKNDFLKNICMVEREPVVDNPTILKSDNPTYYPTSDIQPTGILSAG